MNATVVTLVLELLEHVDRMKALHRANESPSFGDVELLFDRADEVRRALSAPRRAATAPWPTRGGASIESTARRLVELVAATLTKGESQ
jgi:hypothetical protein